MHRTRAGDTPLHAAAANGYNTLVQWLVDQARGSSENAQGHTPLIIATARAKQPTSEGPEPMRSFQRTVDLLKSVGHRSDRRRVRLGAGEAVVGVPRI